MRSRGLSLWATRIRRLWFDCVSDCAGRAVEGLACWEVAVVVGEAEAEAVVVIAGDEMEMEVKYFLARGFSIGDKPVDAIAFEGFVQRSRDPAGEREETGGGRIVQVGNGWCVGSWNKQSVAFVDGLDVHERRYRPVSVDPACR